MTHRAITYLVAGSAVAAVVGLLARELGRLRSELRRLSSLRDAERKGRTTAERKLRQRVHSQQVVDGFNMETIGLVEAPFPDRRGTPRQGTVCPAAEATVVFNSMIPAPALDQLSSFSHVWVLFVFHENTNLLSSKKTGSQGPKRRQFASKVTPPRLGKRVGVFSTRRCLERSICVETCTQTRPRAHARAHTRTHSPTHARTQHCSPHRPNPIGLSVCRLLSVDEKQVMAGVGSARGAPTTHIQPDGSTAHSTPLHSVPSSIGASAVWCWLVWTS